MHGAGDAVGSKTILDVMAERDGLENVSYAQRKHSSMFAVLLTQFMNAGFRHFLINSVN
jgi:hypothetical protein